MNKDYEKTGQLKKGCEHSSSFGPKSSFDSVKFNSAQPGRKSIQFWFNIGGEYIIMINWGGWVIFLIVTAGTDQSFSICGVDDGFLSPENDQMAYRILLPKLAKDLQASVCESFGPGKVGY